jgi:hypothetical protein
LESYLTTENVCTIPIDIFIYISLLYLICWQFMFNWKMVYIEVRWYHIKYINVKAYSSVRDKMYSKIYHTVGTVPKSNRKIVEKATSIPIMLTVHVARRHVK